MVGLLLGRFEQVLAGGRVAGHGSLAEVQALGADLADVVDPHQSGGMAPGRVGQFRVGGSGRVGPGGRRVAQGGLQRALGFDQEPVERGQVAHGGGRHGGFLCGWIA